MVVSDNRLEITEALSFPNPMLTEHSEVKFLVGFTQAEREFDVSVRILNLEGKVVRVLEESFFSNGNYYRGLSWDGRTAQGNPVGRGFYVFDITLTEKETGIFSIICTLAQCIHISSPLFFFL